MVLVVLLSLGALAVAAVDRLVADEVLPPHWDVFPNGVALALAGGAVAAIVLLVAFAVLRAALRRRRMVGAVATLRPLETGFAVVIAVGVVIAVFGGSTGALASVGLVGFGVTLALQRPILSMGGWVAIRFGRLFREGDRIEVQGIVGDVIDITLFQTRVWEIGSTQSPLPWGGAVSPLRATGRVVSISNATFLEHPVANATGDTSFVFDEFAVSVAYEGDWKLGKDILHRIGGEVIDPTAHAVASEQYARLVRDLPMDTEFPAEPVVIMLLQDSWIELRLRYLVDVRRRSVVRTGLAIAWQEATAPHADKLPNVYNRVQPMAVRGDGRPEK